MEHLRTLTTPVVLVISSKDVNLIMTKLLLVKCYQLLEVRKSTLLSRPKQRRVNILSYQAQLDLVIGDIHVVHIHIRNDAVS